MANNSRISTLLLNSQVVTATGNNLYINGAQVSASVSNTGSGLFLFQNPIQSGINKQFINFPTTLNNNPTVITSLINNNIGDILAYQVSGTTNTGYWVLFSETIGDTGYILNTYAANSTGTQFATNVIINNTYISGSINNGNGTITGGGTDGYIPKFNRDGSGLINSIASGDSTGIYINGNLTFNSAIIPNASFRIKSGQIQCFDLVAYSGDNTKPWRALGVYNGATIWSDPILD